MRLLSITVLVFFTFLPPLFAASPSLEDSILTERKIWEEFFAKNLRYPAEAIRAQESARIVLSVKIGPEGNLDSLFLVEDAPEYFQDHVMEVFSLGTSLWNKAILENRPADARYLICFNFEFGGTNGPPADRQKMAKDYIEKGKPEKALKILDQLIEKQPYSYKNYELRSEAHRQLGNTELAQKDYMNSRLTKKKVLSEFDVVVYGQVTRRVETSLHL